MLDWTLLSMSPGLSNRPSLNEAEMRLTSLLVQTVERRAEPSVEYELPVSVSGVVAVGALEEGIGTNPEPEEENGRRLTNLSRDLGRERRLEGTESCGRCCG